MAMFLDFLRRLTVGTSPPAIQDMTLEELIRKEYQKFLNFFYDLHPTKVQPINNAKIGVATQYPNLVIFFTPALSVAKGKLYITALGLKDIDGLLIWTITRCDDCHNFVGSTVILRYRPTYEEILVQLKEQMMRNLNGPFDDSWTSLEMSPEKSPIQSPTQPSEKSPIQSSTMSSTKSSDESQDIEI